MPGPAHRPLHYSYAPSIAGEGAPTLLLLNSLGTTTEIWDPLMPALRLRADIVRLDYPGHGQSPLGTAPRTFDDLADLVVQVLDAVGVTAAHVAGISIGGMTALATAVRHPDRVASVATICSTPHTDAELWTAREARVAEWGTAALIPDVLPRWFTPRFRADFPHIVERYSQMLVACPDSGYQAYASILAGADLRPLLGSILRRALVIVGAEDPAAPVDHAEEAVALLDDARLHVLEGVAHMAPAMAPDVVAALVTEHIADA